MRDTRSPFDEAVDTAIENKKEADKAQRMEDLSFPGRAHSKEERDEFLKPIEEKIPTPKPAIDRKDGSKLYEPASTSQMFAESASCSGWSKQFNGCYERVCCCDKNGQHWCERCCPDRSGRCIAYRVRC